MMNQRLNQFALLLFLLNWSCTPADQGAPAPMRPNIVILLADDLGYADLGCYGGIAKTPNLDQLAARGVRFSDFYAGSSNCSPSRVALMTGRVPARTGMYSYRPPGHPLHLPAEEITIAELLQEAGYRTGHFGKWHLGCLPRDSNLRHAQPLEQGFDYSFGTENNAQPSHLNPNNFFRNGQPVGKTDGYSCQLVVDEAMQWLDKGPDKGQPFFVYLAFHEPHAKIASPPDLVANYSGYPPKTAEYFANIENLDQAAGRLFHYLQREHLDKETLVIFASDNGSYRLDSNRPLRAVKSYLYEGGIRVPGIFSWPKHIAAGMTIEEPAGLIDLFPTICEVVSAPGRVYDHLDGTNILPLFKGESIERDRPLYWFFYRTTPEIAMRIGDWTILGKDVDTVARTHRFIARDMDYIKSMELDSFEAYDLATDLSQRNDLSAELLQSRPELVEDLRRLLQLIQSDGPEIEDLPQEAGPSRLKENWVKY